MTVVAGDRVRYDGNDDAVIAVTEGAEGTVREFSEKENGVNVWFVDFDTREHFVFEEWPDTTLPQEVLETSLEVI